MEGIGYWLFLLFLYLLSLLMKKRQREAAGRELGEDRSAGERIRKTVHSDFLKELFGEELPFVEESTRAEGKPLDVESLSTEPPESFVPESEPARETITVDHVSVSEAPSPSDMYKHKHHRDVKRPRTYGRHPYAGILQTFVGSPEHLKQAFVLKEILGKPRALKRR